MGGWFEVRVLTSFLVGRLSEMGVRQGRQGRAETRMTYRGVEVRWGVCGWKVEG